jgi:hypothetical protein
MNSKINLHANGHSFTAVVRDHGYFATLTIGSDGTEVCIFLDTIADAERIAYTITDAALTARCLKALEAEAVA